MPRTARYVLPDVPLHVVQRGHNRMPSFVDDRDYDLYLGLLEQFGAPTGCAVHAYVLMPNHVHLLLTPHRHESVTDLMRAIGQRYVQHFNRRYVRTGSLWEGRFHSSIIDSERYFLACQCYVELNPTRAELASFPGQYRWSSYRANAEGDPSRIVVPHSLYSALARNEGEPAAWGLEIPGENGRRVRRSCDQGPDGAPKEGGGRSRRAECTVPGKVGSVPGFRVTRIAKRSSPRRWRRRCSCRCRW